MNKTASCIKLIEILYGLDDYVNTNTLASLLDTNPRNIREYFKEIESLGYVIDSSKGLYGGYRILKDDMLPQINLTLNEKDILAKALSKLDEVSFQYQKDLTPIIGKFILSNDKKVCPLRMIDRYPSNMSLSDIEYRYKIFKEAIEEQFKIEIGYLNMSDKEVTHTIYPYKLFMYNGYYFILAFNEIKDDYQFYKLDKIARINNLRVRFSKSSTFKESDFLDEFGIKKNDEYYHIEVELKNLNKVIKNHIYGKNQEVVIIDNNTCILKVDLQNKSSIIAFILSFASNAKVLEPSWLIEDIKNTLYNTLEKYEND